MSERSKWSGREPEHHFNVAYASENGHFPVVELLLESGADID